VRRLVEGVGRFLASRATSEVAEGALKSGTVPVEPLEKRAKGIRGKKRAQRQWIIDIEETGT